MTGERSRTADWLRKAAGWGCACIWAVVASTIAFGSVVIGSQGLLEGEMPWSIRGGRGRPATKIALVGPEARLVGLGVVLIGAAFAVSAVGVIAGPRLGGAKATAALVVLVGCFLSGSACALIGLFLWAIR